MNTSMPRPWVDFNPLMDADMPGRPWVDFNPLMSADTQDHPGSGDAPILPSTAPSIGDLMTDPNAHPSLSDMPGFRTIYGGGIINTGGGSGGGSGNGSTSVPVKIEPTFITTKNMSWDEYYSYQKGGDKWRGDDPNYKHSEHTGGLIVTGTGSERQEFDASDFAGVESYVTGRTGIFSYSEGVRGIAAGTDLGEYFDKQRRGANFEAGFWMTAFVVLSVATIAFAAVGGFAAIADLVYGLGRVVTTRSGLRLTRHALLQMRARGITERMIWETLRKGTPYWDPRNKAINFILEGVGPRGHQVLVGYNPVRNVVKTVIHGTKLFRGRMIPTSIPILYF